MPKDDDCSLAARNIDVPRRMHKTKWVVYIAPIRVLQQFDAKAGDEKFAMSMTR